jgi:hypothetical protein
VTKEELLNYYYKAILWADGKAQDLIIKLIEDINMGSEEDCDCEDERVVNGD